MALHRFYDFLRRGPIPDSSATSEKWFPLSGTSGVLYSYGTTVPSAVAGYSPGCIFVKTNGANGTVFYINNGTSTSCNFVTIATQAAVAGMTIPTGQTLTVTDADALTVGGIIVPQKLVFSAYIPTLATKTIYDVFVAPDAYTVTAIKYVPDIAQGGAMTITPVKATGTNAPAAATTPLVSAGFDGNAAAYTVQSGSLTATSADLALAAGDRIGIVLSTASTTHSGVMTFELKRS